MMEQNLDIIEIERKKNEELMLKLKEIDLAIPLKGEESMNKVVQVEYDSKYLADINQVQLQKLRVCCLKQKHVLFEDKSLKLFIKHNPTHD